MLNEDGFIRQRRNIIVVSLLLLFAELVTLTLPEIDLLGSRATLDHPVAVAPALWIAWAYLLLRYWQAFREFRGNNFRTAYRQSYEEYRMRAFIPAAAPIQQEQLESAMGRYPGRSADSF